MSSVVKSTSSHSIAEDVVVNVWGEIEKNETNDENRALMNER